MDVDAQHKGGASAGTFGGGSTADRRGPPVVRNPSSCHKHLHSPAGPAYCVDLSDQRVVCGSESETVRVWDFTGAQAQADRAVAAKASRGSRKLSWKGRLGQDESSGHYSKLTANSKTGPGSSSVSDSLFQGVDFLSQMYGTSPPVLPPVLEGLSGNGPVPGSRRRQSAARSSWYHGKQHGRSQAASAGRHSGHREEVLDHPL